MGYAIKNVRSTLGRELPANFYRVRYSRSWPKSPPDLYLWKKRVPGHGLVQECFSETHTTHSPEWTLIRKQKPHYTTWPELVAADDALGTPDTKPCSQCGEVKPNTSKYFQKTGREKLRPECKDCTSRYERERNKNMQRKCDQAARKSNDRACEWGCAGELSGSDVQRRFGDAKHHCEYCSKSLSEWAIDYLLPLSKGGDNSYENIRIACSECNSRKQNKSPGEWFSDLLASGIRCKDTPEDMPHTMTMF